MASVEPLDQRCLLAAATWQVVFVDPGRTLTALYPVLSDFIERAGNEWAALIPGPGATLRVTVNLSPGAAGPERRLTAKSMDTTPVRQGVFDQTATARLRYADAPRPGGDIEVGIDPDYLQNVLWFDPAPAARSSPTTPVPPTRVDAYSAILHELGHAFFWNGFRDPVTSAPGSDASVFDTLVTVDATGQPFFNGSQTVAFLGGPLPLTRGNLYHVGNAVGPGRELVSDQLMNGVEFAFGKRYFLSELDRRVVADLLEAGERPPPSPPPPPPPPDPARFLNFGGRVAAAYTAANGVNVLVTLKGPGQGVLRFAPGAPANSDPVALELTGTTRATTLTFTSSSTIALGNLTVDAPLGGFVGSRVNVTGTLTLAGVGRLVLQELVNASVTVGAALPLTQVTLAAGLDSNLTLPAARTVSIGTWLNSDGVAETLTLQSVSQLTIGTLAGAVEVASGTTRARVGQVSGGLVRFGGRASVSVSGDVVGAVLAADQLTGTFSARSIHNTRISSNGPMGGLKVGGAVSGLTLVARDGVGPVQAASITSSTLAVGWLTTAMAPTAFPADAVAFANPTAQLRGLTISRGGSFSNTLIVAPRLGSLALQRIIASNGGERFGLYADSTGPIRFTLPDGAPVLFRATSAAGIFTRDDFHIEVV